MAGWLSIAKKLFGIAALLASVANAQTSGGVFRGEVRDPSSAIVPHASIVIRSNEAGTRTVAESNGDGLYVTPTLIPGSYTLSAVKPGFETEVFGPVTLEVNQTVRVDFGLNIGAASDSVQVEASGTQLLSTESGEISQVVVGKQVAEIPLNGRGWQQLINLSAGVNPGAPGRVGIAESREYQRTTDEGEPVSGGWSLDDFVDPRARQRLQHPFRGCSRVLGSGRCVLGRVRQRGGRSHQPAVEIGHEQLARVAVRVLSQRRSGRGGFLFEPDRPAEERAALQPVRWIFGRPDPAQQDVFLRRLSGNRHAQCATNADERSFERTAVGEFFRTRGVPIIYDPFSAGFARTQFANNTIPASLLDPAAVKITALLPQPNQFDGAGNPLPFNNYAVTRMDTSNVESFDVRLDHQFSEKHNIFARESFQNTSSIVPSLFGPPLGGTILGAGGTSARNQNAGIGYTYTISPTLINELRLGLNRQTTSLTQEDYGQNLAQQFGIPGVNTSPQTSGLSNLNVAGLFDIGGSLLTPLRLATTDWNFTEKITWIKGRHVIRLGFDYQHEMGSSGYLVYGRGLYTFLNLSTSSLIGKPGGNAFASFLVGAPYQILRDQFPPGLVGLLSYRTGFFAQDDIKVSAKLTVNLGARYDIMPYPREMHNRLSNFDPATGTMLIAGANTSQRLVNTDYKDLAPRVGLAYSPSDKTVIRAGYGIGFIDPLGAAGALNSNQFNVPFYNLGNITEFPFLPPTYTLSSNLPGLVMPSPNAPTGNQRYIVPTDGNQYSQTWSFSVQRAINPALMFEVAYVGTSGNRLLAASNINAALPGATDPTKRQPYGPALGEIRELSNSAHSIYHGLQAKIEKRFSRGLYFLGSYTWSKSIDNQSNGTDNVIASGQYPQDPLNTSLDRGLSSFDRPHVFVGSVVWEIPFGRGSAERSRARELVDGVLGGWQVSGILSAQSGAPFSVLMSCADINAQGNNCRPNRLASGALPSDQRSIQQWFDTAAFAIPSTHEYGNAGRDILRAPGVNNIDLALSKSFPWGRVETRRLQIRSEFFNTLNHTNLGVPVNSIDSPAFGSITAAAPGREIQLGARLEF